MLGVKAAPLLCVALGLSTVAGCGKTQEAGNNALPDTTAAKTVAASNDEPAKQFLATLEAQTSFDARLQYVNAHQAEATRIAQSKDPALTQKLSRLMTPPQTAPRQ